MMVAAKLVQASLLTENEIDGLSSTAELLLRTKGRRLRNNRNAKNSSTILRAGLFDSEAKKIWVGDIDIDIEKDGKVLLSLSDKFGPLYILDDTNGGFPRRKMSPQLLRHIAQVVVEGGNILYSRDFAKRLGLIKKS